MILNLFIDDENRPVEVPGSMLHEATDFFDKIDADLDQGWQMSRTWVDNPGKIERCQIVADRILTAVQNGNTGVATLMAAYILRTLPGITGVRVATDGEIQSTEIIMGPTLVK